MKIHVLPNPSSDCFEVNTDPGQVIVTLDPNRKIIKGLDSAWVPVLLSFAHSEAWMQSMPFTKPKPKPKNEPHKKRIRKSAPPPKRQTHA